LTEISPFAIIVDQFHLFDFERLGLISVRHKRETAAQLQERKYGLDCNVRSYTVQADFRRHTDVKSFVLCEGSR